MTLPKFWAGYATGCEGFLPEFLQTCPKSFVRLLPTIFFPQRSWRLFWCDHKRSSCVFLQMLGAIFRRQTTLGAIFVRISRDFVQIFSHFDHIFMDFAYIFDKSRLLGVPLHHRNPASCTITSHTCPETSCNLDVREECSAVMESLVALY